MDAPIGLLKPPYPKFSSSSTNLIILMFAADHAAINIPTKAAAAAAALGAAAGTVATATGVQAGGHAADKLKDPGEAPTVSLQKRKMFAPTSF